MSPYLKESSRLQNSLEDAVQATLALLHQDEIILIGVGWTKNTLWILSTCYGDTTCYWSSSKSWNWFYFFELDLDGIIKKTKRWMILLKRLRTDCLIMCCDFNNLRLPRFYKALTSAGFSPFSRLIFIYEAIHVRHSCRGRYCLNPYF